VIGAGAAGLMSAKELADKGKKVLVLEARERAGGRIFTMKEKAGLLEAGAEFIHGRLPLTLGLLEKANANILLVKGNNYIVRNNYLSKGDFFIEGWDDLLAKLKGLKEDISLQEFLDTRFASPGYANLRKSVIEFVEGYDAADISKVSALAIRDEWLADNVSLDFRIKEGYDCLIKYLENEIIVKGGSINYSTIVKEILWSRGNVEVMTNRDICFHAQKVIIAVPIGVLQSSKQPASILFNPPIPPNVYQAIHQIGYGAVIKFVFVFKEPFWLDYFDKNGKHHKLDNPSFIFSNAFIPTWWTQYPSNIPVLTGWIAGKNALKISSWNTQQLLEKAVESISLLFHVSTEWIYEQLLEQKVFNWVADPFTMGGYTYSSIGSAEVRKVLSTPINDTIYFAGEGVYEGPEMGTVEAALVSGKRAADKVTLSI
ncbi:MAG TPA: NAD(P)/FAD-dependent oxidoreductase, partial [Cytophagaceae bacterium]